MNLTQSRFCVYAHRYKDTGVVFYIGQGTKTRANQFSRSGRCKEYAEITRNNEVFCTIIADDLDKTQAEDLEEFYLKNQEILGLDLVNKLLTPSRAREIVREDYPYLNYDPDSPSGLCYNRDMYRGSKKNRYIFAKAGEYCASLNKATRYWTFNNIGAHRIVYAIFHGCCPAEFQVNHIDGVPSNNRIENLELVTPQQNARHARDTGLTVAPKGEDVWASKIKNETVLQIYDLCKQGLSNEEIGAKLDLEWKHVSLIRLGKRWKHLYAIHGADVPNSPNANLHTLEEVKQALFLIRCGLTNKDVSEVTGIERSQVSRLRYGKTLKVFSQLANKQLDSEILS